MGTRKWTGFSKFYSIANWVSRWKKSRGFLNNRISIGSRANVSFDSHDAAKGSEEPSDSQPPKDHWNVERRTKMSDNEKFEGFKQKMIDENEAKYGEEVRQKYGDEVAHAANQKIKNMTQHKWKMPLNFPLR
jgi:hypothetical protein